jgi:hypothetical protein
MKPAQEEQAALNAFVEQTRTPGDPKYGQTLTPAEFIESFGLAQSDVAKLQSWLEEKGFQKVKVHGDVIAFRGTVGQAESAFATEIHNYTLANGTERFAYASAPHRRFGALTDCRMYSRFRPRHIRDRSQPRRQGMTRQRRLLPLSTKPSIQDGPRRWPAIRN